ncbi:MAG: cysteine hydrolase, partial [Candidatus Helarchaeota archaeon]|nr:cysteine hydrolase [Candidatus Helarchaeota archaeon]
MEKIEKYIRFRHDQMGKINPKKTALLVIDMQKYQVQKNWPLYKAADGINPGMLEYFIEEVENMVPKLKELIDFCREVKIPVIYTKFSSFMPDGSDLPESVKKINELSKDFLDAATFPYISAEASDIIDELKPDPAIDWVLQKNTSGTFISTRLDNYLRNMGVETVLVTG